MSKHCYLLLVIFLLACKPEYTRNKTILSAESVLYSSPDSAYKLLKSIKSPEKLPEADYAVWCLNYVHARYKLYIEAQADTVLINNALLYFQKNGPDKYAGVAFFLQGYYYMIANKNNQAMSSYKSSIKFLTKSNHSALLGYAYTNIAHIYLREEFYNETLQSLENAYKYILKTNNKKMLCSYHRLKAECFYRLQKPIKQILYESLQSRKFAEEINDKRMYFENIFFEAKVYLFSDHKKSKELLLNLIGNPHFYDKNTTILLSYTYSLLNNNDSANFYLNLTQENDLDINSRLIIETIKSKIFNNTGDNLKAYIHSNNAYNIRDSIYNQNNKSLLLKIDKQYDYSQKEQERAKLEIANQQKIILIVLLFVLILIGIFVQLQIRNRHKLKQSKMELEQKLLQLEIDNRKRLHNQSLALIQENIKNKIENTVKYKKLNTGLTNKDKIDDFMIHIARQAVVSENELNFYMQEANNLFGNKISNLKSRFPKLTSSDLIVISLICLGVDFNNICVLLNISLNTLYTRRKRIKTHMGFDKNIDLETWIEQNIIKLG